MILATALFWTSIAFAQPGHEPGFSSSGCDYPLRRLENPRSNTKTTEIRRSLALLRAWHRFHSGATCGSVPPVGLIRFASYQETEQIKSIGQITAVKSGEEPFSLRLPDGTDSPLNERYVGLAQAPGETDWQSVQPGHILFSGRYELIWKNGSFPFLMCTDPSHIKAFNARVQQTAAGEYEIHIEVPPTRCYFKSDERHLELVAFQRGPQSPALWQHSETLPAAPARFSRDLHFRLPQGARPDQGLTLYAAYFESYRLQDIQFRRESQIAIPF